MTENEMIMARYDNLDLFSKHLVVECMRIIKPINKDEIEKTHKDIYYLSKQRANLLSNIIDAIETANRIDGLNAEERKKLLKYAELGEYFCID